MSERNSSRILGMFGHIADALQSSNARSVAQFVKDQRIAPRVAVDASLMNNAMLVDALHTLNGIFSAYIMQAAVRKLSVNDIRTQRVLHSLSTDRTALGSARVGAGTLGSIAASMESFENGLPEFGVYHSVAEDGFSLEAYDDGEKSTRRVVRAGKDTAEQIQRPANLGVGRILEVEVSSGEHSAPLQLMVQFQTQVASGDSIQRVLVSGVTQETAKQRAIRWWAGELDFWREVVMLDDVIKAEREIRAADAAGTGMFKRIYENRRRNGFLSLLSLNPNINELNNIVVINQSTFNNIQAETGNLDFDSRKRDEMFERSGCIFLAVINDKYDSMTLYTHSFEDGTELTSRMIKNMGAKGDVDVMDIFKQSQNHNSLAF